MAAKRLVHLLLFATVLLYLPACAPGEDDPRKQWTVAAIGTDTSGMPWARFYWIGSEYSGKYYGKSAMVVPVSIKGWPYHFNFQFDLGANITMIYGASANSIKKQHPEIDLRSPTFVFGDLQAKYGSDIYNKSDYGDAVERLDTVPGPEAAMLGTMGMDMFRNKVLVIDLPGERFSITNTVPAAFVTAMTDLTLDSYGRILLPMKKGGKECKVLFDNGSSIFQLLVPTANVGAFTNEGVGNTIEISAWGKVYKMMGRPMKDSFVLAGRSFADILVYEDPRPVSGKAGYDAITGNALFFDKVVIFDLKNKKIGVMTPKP